MTTLAEHFAEQSVVMEGKKASEAKKVKAAIKAILTNYFSKQYKEYFIAFLTETDPEKQKEKLLILKQVVRKLALRFYEHNDHHSSELTEISSEIVALQKAMLAHREYENYATMFDHLSAVHEAEGR